MIKPTLIKSMENASQNFPYPIAVVCKKFLNSKEQSILSLWEILSIDMLHPVLQYLSHLLLSDLVATGENHDELYYYVQNILSRPTEGQYVGFLRETGRYYKRNNLKTAVPELVDFIIKSDAEPVLLENSKSLLASLADYRNLLAHGHISDEESIESNFDILQDLNIALLENLGFLKSYKLATEDGVSLMGSKAMDKKLEANSLVVYCSLEVSLRPLIIKLKGKELLLLEDFDIGGKKILFRGGESFYFADKKIVVKGGFDTELFNDLIELLKKVRSEHTLIPEPDWENFKERSEIISKGAIALYKETGKYSADSYYY